MNEIKNFIKDSVDNINTIRITDSINEAFLEEICEKYFEIKNENNKVKTIFYISGEDNDYAYWKNNKPYKEWKTLNNILYEVGNSIIIETTDNNRHIKQLVPSMSFDRFSENEIIRRIFLL